MPTTFGFPTQAQTPPQGTERGPGEPVVRYNPGRGRSSVPTLVRVRVGIILTVLAIIFSRGLWIPFHPAYKAATEVAFNSKELSAVLGENLRTSFGARGFVVQSRGLRYAKLKIPVRGSKGRGTLYAMMRFNGSIWRPSEMALQQGALSTTIISPSTAEQSPPTSSGSGKVYILPLGNQDIGRLQHQSDMLAERFHVPITVLPEEQINPEAKDPARKQLVGETVIKDILIAHPEFADDYDAFVIAVTDQDMYLKEYDWYFAFGDRQYGRIGIISTARLTSPSDFGSSFFADIRLRKMLTKFLGTLYFQLPLSADRTSVLSGAIRSTQDLDIMTDNFIGLSSSWSPMPGTANTCVTQFVSRTRPFSWRLDCTHLAPREFTAESFENDLGIGLFVLRHTDFRLGRQFPLDLQRMYRPMDNRSRAFGIGTNHSLNIFLVGDSAQFTYIDLVLEDGGRVRFKKFPPSPGIDGTYYSQAGADGFYSSILKWTGRGWQLRRIDGWTYVFPPAGPSSTAEQGALTEIHNDKGQVIKFERDREGRLLKVSHFEGDQLEFTYDSQNKIVHAEESSGRYADYSYDEQGRLVRVVDSDQHVEDYSYDRSNRMLEVRWDGEAVLTNFYDESGELFKQTNRDGSSFLYSYDASNGHVDMAHVKSSDGYVADFFFESSGGATQSFPARDQSISSKR